MALRPSYWLKTSLPPEFSKDRSSSRSLLLAATEESNSQHDKRVPYTAAASLVLWNVMWGEAKINTQKSEKNANILSNIITLQKLAAFYGLTGRCVSECTSCLWGDCQFSPLSLHYCSRNRAGVTNSITYDCVLLHSNVSASSDSEPDHTKTSNQRCLMPFNNDSSHFFLRLFRLPLWQIVFSWKKKKKKLFSG